jgi:hypothetical protein
MFKIKNTISQMTISACFIPPDINEDNTNSNSVIDAVSLRVLTKFLGNFKFLL